MNFKVTNSFSRDNLNYEIGTVKNIHYGDIHTKFQTLFDITDEIVPFINDEINVRKIPNENYCKEGDIIFADASEDLNDVGKSIEIVNVNGEKLLSGLHTLLARPKEGIFYLGFKGYLLKSNFVRTQIQKESQGSKVLSINVGRVSKIELSYPIINEQERITVLLSLLDRRIQTQNKIIKELSVLKITIVKRIFSHEFRFKDNNENEFPEWEAKKVGQVYSFKVTNSLSRENLISEGGYVKNIHYGDIHTKFRTLFDIIQEEVPYISNTLSLDKVSNENYLQVGDLIFADASEDLNDVGKSIEIVNLNNERVLSGLHTILARPQSGLFNSGFGGYLFKSPKVRIQIQREAQGTKVLSISSSRLSTIEILIPTLEEQTKIVNFLSSLYSKIEVESQLLKKLEEQKKFLLQQMFV